MGREELLNLLREASLDAVATGYLASLAVFIPTAGWLSDRFGTKRILLLAIGGLRRWSLPSIPGRS